jgi:hypothetical protein
MAFVSPADSNKNYQHVNKGATICCVTWAQTPHFRTGTTTSVT